jgi:RHS repeat-associated protein
LTISDHRIRRFAVGGKITTVAGNGGADFNATEGALATQVSIGEPYAIAAAPDGSVYFATKKQLLKLTPSGRLRLISAPFPTSAAGVHAPVEGVQMSDDYAEGIVTLAVGPDGTLVFNDDRQRSIRQVTPDGIVRTISRNVATPIAPATSSPAPQDGAAAIANGPGGGGGSGFTAIGVTGLAIAQDGSTLAFAYNSIYRISTAQGALTTVCADGLAVHLIPNGDEAFCFDKNGTHLSTVNWRTAQKLLTFEYEPTSKRLRSIKDANGLETKIDRSGSTYTITAPYLQSTKIETDQHNNVTEIRDVLAFIKLNPDIDGRLKDFTDRNLNTFVFGFSNGRLVSDLSPISATPQTLEYATKPDGWTVTHKTPLDRVTTYDVTRGSTNKTTTTFPDSAKRTRTDYRDGGSLTENPDGTKLAVGVPVPDPVWGFKQPIAGKRTFSLPAGNLQLVTAEVTCPPTNNGAVSTQFSAVAQNPSTQLSCNASSTADPLANQTTPPFSNPSHTSIKRVWDTLASMPIANRIETVTRTSAENRVQTQKRDAQGRVVSVQVGGLTPVLYKYDPLAKNQLQFIDRGLRRTELTYRSAAGATAAGDAGFVASIKNALGYSTTFDRDIFGRPKKVVEAVQQPTAGTTGIGWDNNGNLALVTPPGRPDHQLHYNSVNLLDSYTPPVVTGIRSPATRIVPTEDRAAGTETRPDGVVIQRTYVSAPKTEQLDLLTFSGGNSPAGALDYDYYKSTDTNYSAGQAPGKVAAVAGPYGTRLDFKYNGSRLTSSVWSKVNTLSEGAASVAWEYNSKLLRSSEKVTPLVGTALTRSLAYDNDNLLICNSSASASPCATLAAQDVKLVRSTEHAGVTELKMGGTAKLAEQWSYSDSAIDDGVSDTDGTNGRFGELRMQRLTFGAVPSVTELAKIVYDAPPGDARDNAGRILTKTETFPGGPIGGADIVYAYDERGRLENVEAGARSETFGYDANGNRTHYNSVLIGHYDDQDRLNVYGASPAGTTEGDITYSYGKNGELTERDIKTATGVSTWTYTYDALGNLVTVVKPGAQNTTYTYLVDAQGRRIGKREKVGAGTDTLKKRWLYRNQLSPVAELASNGALEALYVYGSRPNVPDLVIKLTLVNNEIKYKTYRLFSDQLGSPRLAVNVDDATDIPYRVDYSAFGVPEWNGAGPVKFDWIPFGFAGGLYDNDTGLVRFGARDYDPSVGRWVSKDPIRFGGRQANLYAYVGNDPINWVDPDGRFPIWLPHLIRHLFRPDPPDWCGGEGVSARLVPDRIGGVDISEACKTHDFCYDTCGSSKQTCDWDLGYNIGAACDRQGAADMEACYRAAETFTTGVTLFAGGNYRSAQNNACGCQ